MLCSRLRGAHNRSMSFDNRIHCREPHAAKRIIYFSFRACGLSCAQLFAVAILFFLPTLVFAAETSTQPKKNSIYRMVPVQKSLASSPQFVLIDNFNSPEWKNMRGGIWHLRNATAKQIKVDRPRQDARNPQFGSSLQLAFDLQPSKVMNFMSSLEKLDVSQADALVFSCKFSMPGKMNTGDSLRLVMEDWRGKREIIDIANSCLGDQVWHEISLPRSQFPALDWDQLRTIAFIFSAGAKPAQGKIQIDELAFYGANEVFFESHLDNIKGFPRTIFAETRRAELRTIQDHRALMQEIAKDTWKYFENAENRDNGFIVDHIRTGDAPLVSDYTSPTNIAMDLMGIVAAEKMKLIPRAEAIRRLSDKLKKIENLRRWKNLYYNFYETTKLSVTRGFISSVDNGWLGIALVVVRQAFDGELAGEATKILQRMDFSEFLDYENNQLSLGFDSERQELVRTHYGMLISEARATSLLGIGKGDLPQDHWWSLYRTPPASWKWQSQKPKGREVEHGGMIYFQGYYQYGDKPIVPSWGGSLFEFLMPTLILDEKNQAAQSFGLNNLRAVQAHQDYALNKQKYPIWGLSPAATTNGRTWKYGEYGLKMIGVKGYPDHGIVTPHVSFLTLNVDPEGAIQNIRKMLDMKMYGEYGFYDSIQLKTGRVNTQYLALDQGMSFLALANFLENDYLQKLFFKDPIGQKAAELWKQEKFFE